MADKRIEMNYERTDKQYKYVLTNEGNKPINLNFRLVLPLATTIEGISINGENVPYNISRERQNVHVSIEPMTLKKRKEIIVTYKGGIGALTNLPILYNDMPDEGIRMESECFNDETNTYTLRVAGAKGKSYNIEIFTPSDITEIIGATEISRKKNHITYRVEFPDKGKEPFIDQNIKLKIK